MNTLRLFRNNLFVIIKRHDLNSNKTSSLPHNCIHFGAISSLHTSNVCHNSSRIGEIDSYDAKPPQRKYRKPVDWLPFPWHRRPRYNIYEQSGDTIKENSIDLSLPKPDFELSDELKNADEKVKQYFSLQTASHGEIKEVCRRQLLQRIQRHPNDFDSLEVKIALKTIQIRSLFQHKEKLGKWEIRNSKVVLPILIQKRNKLLKQLREMDNDRYLWLLEELKLYYKPNPLSVKLEMYCKKWDLRKLTKEYCQKMIADKKAAYHEELKKQQVEFLEEKKQILAWIEEEEKALNVKQ
ncbi:28S ribosomal protein S15, mitochondrial-like [Argiope bruennichi]|uniref:28S ribosomal protein S15, mitochondrial-like n=1 Tax=Argiope bruennichi TaxID=94029 RepID=UPI002494DFAF|nr:28S ribosomal protein S15, mitochondrial-like [Argiope bruennichi]